MQNHATAQMPTPVPSTQFLLQAKNQVPNQFFDSVFVYVNGNVATPLTMTAAILKMHENMCVQTAITDDGKSFVLLVKGKAEGSKVEVFPFSICKQTTAKAKIKPITGEKIDVKLNTGFDYTRNAIYEHYFGY